MRGLKQRFTTRRDQPNARISAKRGPSPKKATIHGAWQSASPKKLTFVIAHLGPGGAQRVAVNAANILVCRGFEVHVVVIAPKPPAYSIDPRVVLHHLSSAKDALILDADQPANFAGATIRRIYFGGSGRLAANVSPRVLGILNKMLGFPLRIVSAAEGVRRKALTLRKKIKTIDPDSVLSFLTQTNILTVLATRRLKIYTVISERNDPRLQRHRPGVELLRRLVYPWADVVTANSQGALAALESFVPKRKLAFLPNPLLTAPSENTFDFGRPTVVAVGRLVEQKGLDILLSAWASVIRQLPDWKLALVGDGPLASQLQALARELGIEKGVEWLGYVADPFPLFRGAKLFVMTSRFEGTPNSLLEAMACGLPSVISNASPGPCELIGYGESAAGLIVPVEDAESTADAIIRLARDHTLRRRLGDAARERARIHEADTAIEVWLRVLRCE
jgi:GalNAc-alpha-(1->4)-GalNAc-alpha-(1->3)-diNAcBac-PP-undecaprenol alpha-1,4-N-acetyl-D-galactosaminyltransferase